MTLLASSIDDSAFAWAYVLTLPSFYLSGVLYVVNFGVASFALIKRYIGFVPLLVGALAPPALAFAMVGFRNGPGWLYFLTVLALPVLTVALLGFFLTAGRRARARARSNPIDGQGPP